MEKIFLGQIRSMTFKGLGVVNHPSGMAFFVAGAWPGDEGEFEVQSVEKRYGYAKLIRLTKPSQNRRKTNCPHLGFEPGTCGGCPWMIADYKSQLEQKDFLLKNLLQRADVINSQTKIFSIIASPVEFSYRNRAQLKTDGKSLGYVSSQSNELAPIADCIVLTDKNRETLKLLKMKLPNNDWEPKDKFLFNFLELDEDIDVQDVQLNQRRPFKQGNDAQNQNMKDWVSRQIGKLDKNQNLLELFSGSGNFTQILSKFKNVLAVEISKECVDELNSKELTNVQGVCENIYIPSSWKKLKEKIKTPEVLFLDPPREGFSEVQKFLKEFTSIKTILYISCDASTFAQDAKQMKTLGYQMLEVQPVDQFPQTPHIEVLSLFQKQN